MRDERNHLIPMNGMNGPLLVGACGGGIPVATPLAMLPVLTTMNGNDQVQPTFDGKYDDKKRLNSSGQGQNKNMNRKLPSNGGQRMQTVRPVFNSKQAAMGGGGPTFRPPQNCLAPYLSRYPTLPHYGGYPASNR